MVLSFTGGSALDILQMGVPGGRETLNRFWCGVDGGPTLKQRWFGVAYLLGSFCIAHDINLINR